MTELIQSTIDRALEAYDKLAELGEELEDEWSYVNDLVAAWRDRLVEVADRRGREPAPEAVSGAVDQVIAEIGLIVDRHRAIDWLSTFPQVVLLTLDERP